MKKQEKKVVIKDIAKEAGVAISTVSFVLNNSRNVTKKTKDRVLKAIKKLNYQPSSYARGLRTKTTKIIGVIIPDISTPFYSQVVIGLEQAAREREYNIILVNTHYNQEEEKKQVMNLINNFIDGIILLSGFNNSEFVKKLHSLNIPIVLADREIDNHDIPSVSIDNVLAIEKLVDYVSSMGHKNIGYISTDITDHTVLKDRYKGYLSGLKKNNTPFKKDFIYLDKSNESKTSIISYEKLKEFINSYKLPTVFIASSDYTAYILVRALKDEGYIIPRDISVAGFGNLGFNSFFDPLLTTMKQPKKKLGYESMNLLINIINNKKVNNKKILLETDLIVRESVIKL